MVPSRQSDFRTFFQIAVRTSAVLFAASWASTSKTSSSAYRNPSPLPIRNTPLTPENQYRGKGRRARDPSPFGAEFAHESFNPAVKLVSSSRESHLIYAEDDATTSLTERSWLEEYRAWTIGFWWTRA